MNSIPMIMCKSVSKSAKWYCILLDAENDHDGDEFDRIIKDGEVLLMLHHWTEAEHGLRPPPPGGRLGDGITLWFGPLELEAVSERAKKLHAEIVAEPWYNGLAHWHEFTVRDIDGYGVSVYS